MIDAIENEFLKVSAETDGAQLKSIFSKETGKEYLWQGDAAYWTGRAYNLFPICGRMTNNTYTFEGKNYEMLIHGFVRRNQLSLKEQTKTSMTFELSSSEITRPIYPFEFVYQVIYSLEKNKLNITYRVVNTDDKQMIFCVGGHPGFNVPFDGGAFEDYFVEFPFAKEVKKKLMSDACYMTGKEESFVLDEKKVSLDHSLFDKDVIILQGTGGKAIIRGKNTGENITFTYPDMTFLGLWHKPHTDAPFLCLEPWSALPAFDGKVDDLANKDYMAHLAAGETYNNTYSVEINK